MNGVESIERRLRQQQGPRERGYRGLILPATLDASVARASVNRGRRSWVGFVGPSLAVVALAVAVLVVALVTAPQGSQLGGAGSSSPMPTQVPTSSPSASADTGVRPCSVPDLAWTPDPWSGAAGSRGTSVLFRAATSAQPCQLSGRPSVAVIDGEGRVVITVAGHAGAAVVLDADSSVAEVGIAWSNWCEPAPAGPLKVMLKIAASEPQIEVAPLGGPAVTAPPCMGEGQPSNLSVTDFQRSSRPPPEG